MVKGLFLRDVVPVVKVAVAWGQALQTPFFILDTGFSGDLQVTPEIAQELGLQVSAVTNTKIANGEIIAVPTAQAIAAMEGETNYVQVLVSDSTPLVGISFLSKFSYKAILDCKHKTVLLERVV